MLDKIRNNVAHNQVIRGSLILITLAFVFWGMGIQSLSFFSKNYAIKAGNVEISATDYNRAYQMAVARTQQQLGGQKLPDSFMEQINKQTQATTTASLTNQALLEAYASSENIFVDDKTIYQILEVTPSFQKDGKFDKETYKAVLRNYNFSPIEYEEMLVKQVQANMIEILFNQTATVSELELDAQLKYIQERRDLDIISLNAKDVTTLPKATDEELKAIYEEKADEFKIEEARDYKLLVISKKALSEGQTVTDEEVKQYFDENKDEFFTKPEFKVQQILVKEQKTADKVLAIADLSANFNKYVQEYSTDTISKPKNGDMGWLSGDIFGAEFENAVHSAKKGEVAKQAVKTVFGFHIFKLTDVKESKLKSFDEVKAKIKANLLAEKAETELNDKIDTALDMVSAGEKLENISKQLGFKLQEFKNQTAQAKNSYIDTVFETALDEVSQPIELDYDATAFIEVTNIVDESTKPFAEVKNVVEATYKEQKTAELLAEKADKVLEDIMANELTFKQAAKKYKLVSPIKSVVSVARIGNQAKQISNEISMAAFDAKANSVLEETITDGQNIVIVKVLDSYQEATTAEQKDQVRQALIAQKTNDLYLSFINSLQNTYKPSVNDAMIKQIVESN